MNCISEKSYNNSNICFDCGINHLQCTIRYICCNNFENIQGNWIKHTRISSTCYYNLKWCSCASVIYIVEIIGTIVYSIPVGLICTCIGGFCCKWPRDIINKCGCNKIEPPPQQEMIKT